MTLTPFHTLYILFRSPKCFCESYCGLNSTCTGTKPVSAEEAFQGQKQHVRPSQTLLMDSCTAAQPQPLYPVLLPQFHVGISSISILRLIPCLHSLSFSGLVYVKKRPSLQSACTQRNQKHFFLFFLAAAAAAAGGRTG